MIRANIDFISFREIILNKMNGSECEVRRAIGRELRRVPRFEGAKAPIHYTEWHSWLHEAPLPREQPADYGLLGRNDQPRDLSNFVSTLATRGSGDKKLAAAFYYRLHMYLADESFARSIDHKAFGGQTFEQAHNGLKIFVTSGDYIQSTNRVPELTNHNDSTSNAFLQTDRNILATSINRAKGTKYSELRLPRHEGGFYGRTDEISRILDDLSASDTKMVVICAPGGQGKTALTNAVLNSLNQDVYKSYNWIFEW